MKECLSLAFVHALTGLAGINLQVQPRHDYGIDGTFRPVSGGPRHAETGFPVDFQMKSTIHWRQEKAHIVYDLDAKTYNDLVGRDPIAVPCVLILLCLPQNGSDWLSCSESEMILRNCCYWIKLEGQSTSNKGTKRIRIPRTNILSADGIREILKAERARWL